MDSCRSKRQILILDCCHSGAFARGTKGEQKAITETTFEGSGFGRVVLTASDSTQYALEGDQVIKQSELSLFTHFLLEGLQTGAADVNNDGLIALDEWYDYTYTRVISETPRQVPHKWSYNQQGDLIIAKNPFVKKRVVELPAELLQALESSFVGIRESAVNELGKYLRSSDPEMIELAISYLQKMKEDDSRRISFLAERLLSEFEQTRIPNKATSSKPTIGIESATADMPSDEIMPTPKADEIETAEDIQTSQPNIEKLNLPVDGSSVFKKFVFTKSFWFKWIGTIIVAILFSTIFYYYNLSDGDNKTLVVVLFMAVTGLSSTIQWFLFRETIVWWIAENLAAGLVLGLLHNYIYTQTGDWWDLHLYILLAIWVAGNFAFGPILMAETQQASRKLPALLETGARQNIFILLLSITLVISALSNFIIKLEVYNLINPFLTLYGVVAALTGLLLFLKKDVPKNFGFIMLAVFLILDGINVERFIYDSNFLLYFFAVNGIFAVVSGLFFIARKEVWKNFGFLMLSGYLISTGAAGITSYNPELSLTFLVISTFFAIPAAFFFFLWK